MASSAKPVVVSLRLIPVSRVELFALVYRDANPEAMIAFGTLRPSRSQPEPHANVLTFATVRNAGLVADRLQERGLNPGFIKWNPFGPGLLPRGESRDDVNRAMRERLECLLSGGRPRHVLTHAHRLESVAVLTIDCDVGREEKNLVTADQALSLVNRMAATGRLPAPSFVGKSGRGLYLGYALAGEAGGLPPATEANRKLFLAAAAGLIARCRCVKRRWFPPGAKPTLNPDHMSKNAVQWFKTPDSLHPKRGTPIRYFLWPAADDENGDGDGTGHDSDFRRYGLETLAAWIPEEGDPGRLVENGTRGGGKAGAWPLESYRARYRASRSGGVPPQPKRKYGGKSPRPDWPFVCRWEELRMIARHRGGIPRGSRRLWASIYYNTVIAMLTRARIPGVVHTHRTATREALDWTREFSQIYFQSPLTKAELKAATANSRLDFRNGTLARLLDVSVQEAVEVGLSFIIPDSLRKRRECERKAAKKAESFTVRKEERNGRMLAELDAGIPVREIAATYNLSRSQINRIRGRCATRR